MTSQTQFKPVRLISPIDDTLVAEIQSDHDSAVNDALNRAVDAQRGWRSYSLQERSVALRSIAQALRDGAEQLATTITLEMGKTKREALGEVEKSAWACDYYAELGPQQLAPEEVATESTRSYVQFPPLGVVLAIMPWNYPVWQVMRAAAPTIMAGNTVVLKHASNVTGSALLLKEVFERADIPESLLEVIVIGGSRVADVIADRRIAAVTLTGSEQVGVEVAAACAHQLKPSVLELGGSDGFIVLADADIDAAADAAVKGRFLNAGQSCIAAKRFVVVDSVADEFLEAFAARTRELVVDDPRGEVDMGPMARTDLRDEIFDQVRRGIAAGGRVVVGGDVPDRPGAWIEPTIVDRVTPDNPLAAE
jgi:succinate-semialdehyde dehydrogenase/glutarate-semialdehyde dehydrogenase